MNKQSFFKMTLRRENLFKSLLLSLFLGFASYPRLLLEVFIRKNFGERYFRLSSAITLTLFLALLPVAAVFWSRLTRSGASLTDFMGDYWAWYAFLALFMVFSVKRHREIKKGPSVYDFKKFSLYNGTLHPRFESITLPGFVVDRRLIEMVFEPAFFFIIGVILLVIGQGIGGLLIVCSIFYSLGYVAAYAQADDYIMDKIDEIIINEGMADAIVNGKCDGDTRWFNFTARLPKEPVQREKILTLLQKEQQEETYQAI